MTIYSYRRTGVIVLGAVLALILAFALGRVTAPSADVELTYWRGRVEFFDPSGQANACASMREEGLDGPTWGYAATEASTKSRFLLDLGMTPSDIVASYRAFFIDFCDLEGVS